jgi:hypothetical protein
MSCEKTEGLSRSRELSPLDVEHLGVCEACTEALIRAPLIERAEVAFVLRRSLGPSLLIRKQQLLKKSLADQTVESIRRSLPIAICLLGLLLVTFVGAWTLMPLAYRSLGESPRITPLLGVVLLAASAVLVVWAAVTAIREILALQSDERKKRLVTIAL